MTFRNIADAKQLATLTSILDDYCEQVGIEGLHPAREHLARRLIALFSGGIDSPDDIKMALDSVAKDFPADLRGSVSLSVLVRTRRAKIADRARRAA